MRLRWMWLVLALCCSIVSAQATENAGPRILLDTADVAKILNDPGVRILDVRPPAEYGQGHIPGAVNLPAPATDDPAANQRGLPLEPQRAQLLFRDVYRFRPKVVSGDFDLILVKPINPLFRVLLGGADPLVEGVARQQVAEPHLDEGAQVARRTVLEVHHAARAAVDHQYMAAANVGGFHLLGSGEKKRHGPGTRGPVRPAGR